jgi:hypothetical protein
MPLFSQYIQSVLAQALSTTLQKLPGANPTIASYNASVVNFYNATGSLARLENKKYFILL